MGAFEGEVLLEERDDGLLLEADGEGSL
jgi:hypothetical protein